MVEKVKVKTEYKPERCEICHQTDYFNPETNSCSRCAGVTALAANQERNLSSKKQIPYYNFYVEDDLAKKQALRNGVLNLVLGLIYGSALTMMGTSDTTHLLLYIFTAIIFVGSGIGNLIDWSYLRNGKELILQNYRNLISQAFAFLVVIVCIGGQLFIGANIYLSLLAIFFILFNFGEYYKLHKKVNETDIKTK